MEHGVLISEEIVQVPWMLGNKKQGAWQHSMTNTMRGQRESESLSCCCDRTTGFSTLNSKDVHLANDSGGWKFKQQGTNLARPLDCVIVREKKWMGKRQI